jgi:hypothetical protein
MRPRCGRKLPLRSIRHCRRFRTSLSRLQDMRDIDRLGGAVMHLHSVTISKDY